MHDPLEVQSKPGYQKGGRERKSPVEVKGQTLEVSSLVGGTMSQEKLANRAADV